MSNIIEHRGLDEDVYRLCPTFSIIFKQYRTLSTNERLLDLCGKGHQKVKYMKKDTFLAIFTICSSSFHSVEHILLIFPLSSNPQVYLKVGPLHFSEPNIINLLIT